jgi:hypothetical protein
VEVGEKREQCHDDDEARQDESIHAAPGAKAGDARIIVVRRR